VAAGISRSLVCAEVQLETGFRYLPARAAITIIFNRKLILVI
jgi:hypothetical protein